MTNACDILKKEHVSWLETVMKESRNWGVEIGINFCKDQTTGKIYPTSICHGDSCSIRVDAFHTCSGAGKRLGGEHVGTFHTHPGVGKESERARGRVEKFGGDPLSFSSNDLFFYLDEGSKFGCIGDTKTNRVKCIHPKEKDRRKYVTLVNSRNHKLEEIRDKYVGTSEHEEGNKLYTNAIGFYADQVEKVGKVCEFKLK